VADARLPDGSRMHVVLPPLAPAGPLVSIRRFPRRRFDLDALTTAGMLDQADADFLRSCVRNRISVAISGSTASGKTTLLNALLGVVDPGERIVLIEEIPELSPASGHVVSLVARFENVEGRGAVGLEALLRAALRMRPDRIVVGEVRGPEALVALGALSSGHEGSMVTVHAASATRVVERMVALALQGPSGAGEASLRRQFEDAFGAVVHLERTAEGRRVAEIMRRA
jgi:pilus assembly protein CpaF